MSSTPDDVDLTGDDAAGTGPVDELVATVVVPIGRQSLTVPRSVGRYLQELSDMSEARLAGTRVWFQRRNGELIVHVGDVECDDAAAD